MVGFFEKTFGKFFKLMKGVVGVLLAVAIPALAFLLNSPVFEKLKEGLFNLVDYIFETGYTSFISKMRLFLFSKNFMIIYNTNKRFFCNFYSRRVVVLISY